jgi:transposase
MPVPDVFRRIEVFTGSGRRRSWSAEEKAAIVAASYEAGATVSGVARRHGLTPQQLFTWRRLARDAAPEAGAMVFVPAMVEASAPPGGSVARPGEMGRGRSAAVGIEVEMAGAVVRIGPTASKAAIAAVIRALKGTP